MRCKDCPKWQGSRRSKWGDCYCVVGELFPQLYRVEHLFREGIRWTTPFDPHDCKYYDPLIRTFFEKMAVVPDGVRKQTVTEDDIVYDEQGGERVGRVKVTYFQTRRDYSCTQ
jgi:hypothetical protein